MEDKEKIIKRELIDYIRANDKHWAAENLEAYSVTTLIIIKTEIESRIKYSKGRE